MEFIFKDFDNIKRLRAMLLHDYIGADKKYVCFSCGNTSKSLKRLGLDVLDISPNGDLIPNRWFTIQEVRETFPDRFDATCGHLSIDIMNRLSNSYKGYFKHYLEMYDEIIVPTGSGETIVCLALAFPNKKFVARYNIDASTEYHEEAPLNKLVEQLAFRIEFADKKEGKDE